MAVPSLFENTVRPTTGAGRARTSDLGKLSRERRLAYYLRACEALGLDPLAQPLRFVRCNDGRLRLFDPSRQPQTPTSSPSGSGKLAALERELAVARASIAGGGGIAYEIDLATGDLRVADVLRSAKRGRKDVAGWRRGDAGARRRSDAETWGRRA
jgi:hypothetical protein